MTLREFWRFHFLKALLALVVIQIGIIAFIQNFNHKPVAINDEASVIENRLLKINPLLNDTDKDEETELAISSFEQPFHGKVEQNGNMLYYTPEDSFFGVDSFQYAVTDGKKISDLQFIKIEVQENLPPEAVADTVKVYAGKTVFINPIGNDTDKEGDSIYIAEFTQPENGKLKEIENGYYYVAANGSKSVDSFTYTVSDGKSTTQPVEVVVLIEPKGGLYPWMATDIGDVALKGSTEKNGSKFTLKASGRDIWNDADAFQYMYQFVEGDCEMIAKVESIEGTNEWVKAGIMIRENLSPGSKHSFVVLSNQNGATVHQRTGQNERSEGSDKHPEAVAPYWVKLKRQGSEFTFSISEDGSKWKQLEKLQNDLSSKVYIGIVCTSHNNDELATITYSNLNLKAREVRM